MSKRVKAVRKVSVEPNEPMLNPNSSQTQHDLGKILNWYNYNKSSEDARHYFLTYLKTYDMDVFDKLKSKSSNIQISTTVGWLCRIYTLNESLFPLKYLKNIKDETNKVLEVVSQDETKSFEENTKPKVGVQEHLQNQLKQIFGELDVKIDEFLSSECKTKFLPYEWFQQKKLKYTHAKSVADYYERHVLSELKDAQLGKCEQLCEGYSFLTKKQLGLFVDFVSLIVDDATKWHNIAKQITKNNRTPRVKRQKSPLKQVEKLQFLKEHGNLKSVPPTQIVGATQLWIYNVKYKSLGVYVCTNPHGFSVKGCTVLNYDVNESISKTLRKPEQTIEEVLQSGKVALKKILPSLRTKEKKLTGRINKDTILLRVL